MIFRIAKKEFLDALSLSARAISTTTPLPSLSGIKITVSDNSLVLISSDSNISIRTAINNNDRNALIIKETGEIVLDARYLLEMVRKIDGEFIDVETIDGTLIKISGGNSEFKVNGMEGRDYPMISFDTRDDKPFTISTELFNQIIEETSFACSEKETRPVLTGVNLKAVNHRLYANATDSFRLASKTIDIDNNLNFNITVPSKYLDEIIHAIINKDEITIAIDDQKISFIYDNTIIQTRLLDDEFPDTSRLIPASHSTRLLISTSELLGAIDRTLFIKADGKNTIKMKISTDSVEVTSTNQSVISSYEKIGIISIEGSPLEISCSGKYLLDALKTMDSDETVIDFSGELKPMVVHRNDDLSLIQLISPVRTYH